MNWFRQEPLPVDATRIASEVFQGLEHAVHISYETCFYVELRDREYERLGNSTLAILEWLLAETFQPERLSRKTSFEQNCKVIEIGPRLNFQTAWSANAVTICHACGISDVVRLERSRRFAILQKSGSTTTIDPDLIELFISRSHDRMIETIYIEPLRTFRTGMVPEPVFAVPVLRHGRKALEDVNTSLGLGFDEYDINLYLKLFRDQMERDPTNVELFDLAQSNSEHSRHWFFKGRIVIDEVEMPKSLLDIVQDTLAANTRNSVLAFADNSSTIRGYKVPTLVPDVPGTATRFSLQSCDRDVLFTAETHNFPSGVAPFPGAETGSGGRIRDTAATGTGSLVVAGTAGYAVGNLRVPGVPAPWEDTAFTYPANLASPIRILIEASNGASDYGNKFGEPVICGFARTYGMRIPSGERREYVKPIMFSGGMGQMEHKHAVKGEASVGLWVVKIGGPAYRIGMGGGAASSMMQGDNRDDLDFNAVQRGDAEMEQKAYRVLRACVEMGDSNPIVSIHDQGAGGNCNVVKELIYPAGARINLRRICVGDSSLSALEIWGAEYQEQFGLLLRPESLADFQAICSRENVLPALLGQIDGSGRIVLWDEECDTAVVDMDLEAVLGDLPRKTFRDKRAKLIATSLQLAPIFESGISEALDRVMTLMTVGSKRYLTTKVDRSVTGLVAQQQCVGPLQLPLANAGVVALTHFDVTGSATAIGERPSLTSLSPAAMARMSVAEMLTNLASVRISAREDIKCEANWMWAAKLSGDGAALYDAAVAMRDAMIELGIAVDGGKDSLSMAAKCPSPNGNAADGEQVRAPGTLVISGYCSVPDVSTKLTPDIKSPGNSVILHVDIARGNRRLGGSCLAQVYKQLGDETPDVDLKLLANAFDTVQILHDRFTGTSTLLSYHDISDGGLLVALLEMGFAGNSGMDIVLDDDAEHRADPVATLFAEELGMLLEIDASCENAMVDVFHDRGIPCAKVASTRADLIVNVSVRGETIVQADITSLRSTWERTAFALERLQSNPKCVDEEEAEARKQSGPSYVVPWTPRRNVKAQVTSNSRPKVAVMREEGSNGDREMTAAFHMAGFEAWDVSVRDILSGTAKLSEFRGVVFVGGFSYADVLDSAKGWAGVIRFNDSIRSEIESFYNRRDTFSLGVCNGCQLMSLLGRVPLSPDEIVGKSQPRFIHNESGRFESRFSTVSIDEQSPAIMLRGMGGARLGIWSAHGEGRAYFPDAQVLKVVEQEHLAPIRYVDDEGKVTTKYPFNPNGSAHGVAALCSRDGRHLAMMPHPERTVLKWQWAYLPRDLEHSLEASPWLTMFQNARVWCDEN